MTSGSQSKPTVLIFKETLLPISETFIAAQSACLTRFVPRYVGLGQVAPSLEFPENAILLTSRLTPQASLLQKLYRRTGFAPGFHREAASAGAQLIHAHFASGGRSALPLARHLRVPLVVTLHGSDVTAALDFKRRYGALWREAAVFVCVSDFIRQKAIQVGFPREKLQTIFIGVDRNEFHPRETHRDRNLVLFVGRLVEKKGCAYLLRAMAQVHKSHTEAETVVIGDGPLRASLEALAKELRVPCSFLGARPAPAVREWMSKARIFCVPSVTAANGDSEGLGMVFAEAQGMGTPVATFNHAGMSEIVLHGETGLLAEERNTVELASNILRLFVDDALWTRCSEQGVARVANFFDLKRQTGLLEAVYCKVCESKVDAGSTASVFKRSSTALSAG
jgi:colanic acid/amylovoran biosynthesis glycosyltransferase